MPLPSELIERLADAGARRELGRLLDALAGAAAFKVERGEWTPTSDSQNNLTGTPTFANAKYAISHAENRLGGVVSYQLTIAGLSITASGARTFINFTLPLPTLGSLDLIVGSGVIDNGTTTAIAAVRDAGGSSSDKALLFFMSNFTGSISNPIQIHGFYLR
jgi:hypothetical protein